MSSWVFHKNVVSVLIQINIQNNQRIKETSNLRVAYFQFCWLPFRRLSCASLQQLGHPKLDSRFLSFSRVRQGIGDVYLRLHFSLTWSSPALSAWLDPDWNIITVKTPHLYKALIISMFMKRAISMFMKFLPASHNRTSLWEFIGFSAKTGWLQMKTIEAADINASEKCRAAEYRLVSDCCT